MRELRGYYASGGVNNLVMLPVSDTVKNEMKSTYSERLCLASRPAQDFQLDDVYFTDKHQGEMNIFWPGFPPAATRLQIHPLCQASHLLLSHVVWPDCKKKPNCSTCAPVVFLDQWSS
jgi:hypothetical protein